LCSIFLSDKLQKIVEDRRLLENGTEDYSMANTKTWKVTVRTAVAAGCATVFALGGAPNPTNAQTPKTPPKVVQGNQARGSNEVSYATCPEGTTLIGGGYQIFPTVQVNFNNQVVAVSDIVRINAPSLSRPNTWAAQANSGIAISYALCSNN
jgi:hypothetical protein